MGQVNSTPFLKITSGHLEKELFFLIHALSTNTTFGLLMSKEGLKEKGSI